MRRRQERPQEPFHFTNESSITMSGSLNKVCLIGNLGKDPEVRSLQNGARVCNLTIATSESWKDKTSGERKEKTEWHKVVVFNDNLTQVAEKFLRKGSKVYLEGALETRKWQDQQGQDRYSTEIVLKQFNGVLTMLDGKAENSAQSGHSQAKPNGAAPPLDDSIDF